MFVTECHETVWHCVGNPEVKMYIGGTKYIWKWPLDCKQLPNTATILIYKMPPM